MKSKILTLIQALLFSVLAIAQSNTICVVKYKDYSSNMGTLNYWFFTDNYIHIREPNFRIQNMKGFPVLINSTMTTQTDTIKYNKEFNEIVNLATSEYQNKPKNIELKYFKSDTVKRLQYLAGLKKSYLVLDTLTAISDWTILEDTMTFMGYKCQKAFTMYNSKYYYAWFTKQLPYNSGPMGFRGLPGLILKVYDFSEKKGYEAILIDTKYKGEIPKIGSNFETVTKNDWLQLLQKSNEASTIEYKNLIDKLKKEGAIIHDKTSN